MTTTEPRSADLEPPGLRRLGTVPALDGVRGFAVLLVMMVHLQLLMPFRQTGVGAVDGFIRGGYLGVDLFFVLSGFLITALLLDESARGDGSVRFGAFYLRRALRLLPALYVLLLAHALYARIEGLPADAEWATIRSAVLYVSNWQVVTAPETVAHELTQLWSLAIEEQFYLWWPALVVLFLGPKRSARTVGLVLGGSVLFVALWRAHLLDAGVYWTELTVRTDTRVDGLLIGALLASLWVRRATPTGPWVDRAAWLGLGGVLACVAVFRGPDDLGYQGGLTVFALAAALVLLGLVEGTWGGRWLFEIRPLRALGRVSYGVYLWHYPVFYVVAVKGRELPPVTRVGLALAITAAAVLASWHLVERPALTLKARFGAHRAVPTARPVGSSTMAPQPVPLPGWGTERGRMAWAGVGIVALVGAVVGVQAAADDRSPDDPDGLAFPRGDVDRTGYWNLVDLQPRIIDDFAREDASSLAAADTGQPWGVVSGAWGTEDERAVVGADDSTEPRLAVLEQPDRDGLVEVTLVEIAEGAGLVVRYEDPGNLWSVVARPSEGVWTVVRLDDGQPTEVAEFEAPTDDGTTVSVTSNGVVLRVMIDGVEHLTTGIDPVTPPFRSGLIAVGPEAHEARWDRYLVLRFGPESPERIDP